MAEIFIDLFPENACVEGPYEELTTFDGGYERVGNIK